MSKIYDLIILGAGPAGLAAGIYAGRDLLDTLIIEKGVDGGQIVNTDKIENYPGSELEDESGYTLVERMTNQVARFGAERVTDSIKSVELGGDVKTLHGVNADYQARAVILAMGAHPRPIGCKNEKNFVGQGISFCATCDANFFRGLEVYVVGGGNSAVEEAMYLTHFARKVTVIHRRDALRADRLVQQKAFETPNLGFMWDSVVDEVDGDMGLLSKMVVRNTKTGELRTIEADPADGMFGLFGFVGNVPNSDVVEGAVQLDERGYIPTDEDMRTNVPGVFAAGDIRPKSLRQVVTATADGAIAAKAAYRYLEELK